jgi:hypothetical protein
VGSATALGQEGAISFPEHARIRERVEDKIAEEKRGFPGSNVSIIGKAADATTVSAKHGTQEIVELLTSPEGRAFVRTLAATVVEGYLTVSTTDKFIDAAKMGARGATSGSIEASEKWMLSMGSMLSGVANHPSAELVRRCAGPLLIACLTAMLALAVGLLLLVWKILLFGN